MKASDVLDFLQTKEEIAGPDARPHWRNALKEARWALQEEKRQGIQRRLTRKSKAQSLVDLGLADDLADAREQLEDMGEL